MKNPAVPARPIFSYRGKTKDVAAFSSRGRRFLLLRFKDNLLGRSGRPDSGGNEVVGTRAGKGAASAAMCEYFFKKFAAAGIPTHFRGRPSRTDVVVEKTRRIGVEFICRNRAWGSYLSRGAKSRVGALETFGRPVVEYTLKSDRLDDPLLDSKQILNHATSGELAAIRSAMLKMNRVARAPCRRAGIELVDFKAEFGRRFGGKSSARASSRLLLIDDFSCDTARFFKGRRLLGHFEVCKALGIPLAKSG